MVLKSINLSQEAITRVETYRRSCKDRIPSFSEVINQLILESSLLTKQNKKIMEKSDL